MQTYLVVTYNPPPEVFDKQLSALNDEHVIIVDNGSQAATIELLRVWIARLPAKRKLIELGENQGIAAAQNRGMELAQTLGCQFVLLLDHDSVPAGNLLTQLVTVAKMQLKDGKPLAAVGARLVDPRASKELGFAAMVNGVWRNHYCTDAEQLLRCEFLNSSGSLIYLPAWEKIGCFDESFFIDHVETDWYMRAKAQGFHVYGSCQGILEHYLGDAVVKFWCFGERSMPHRSAGRHYTIVRNSLWLYRRDYVPFSWKVNNFAKLVFTLVFFSLFDKDRSQQFRSILHGFYDGLFN